MSENLDLEISETVNPWCDQLVDGRECIHDAGHDGDCTPRDFHQAEKINYLFDQAKRMEALLENLEPQITGLVAQAGPMLESLAPLLGQASSPMGRIFGSLIR